MISSDPKFGASNSLPLANARVVRFAGTENEPLLQQIGALRLQVWRATGTTIRLPKETVSWRDPVEDSDGIHLAVFRGDELVAATRLNVYQKFIDMPGNAWMDSLTEHPSEPYGVIGRLVVSSSFQHFGLGKFLDKECLKEAARQGCSSLLCDVPPYRVAPLEKMGFRVIQPPKLGVTLPEIAWTVMYIELKDNK